MKKILLTILIMVVSIRGFCCQPNDLAFGEINFIQDSINPLKIFFIVKLYGGGFCSFQTDSCLMQWECPWNGVYGSLHLSDTAFSNPLYPCLIYSGWHTFDSIPPDSLITGSFIAQGRISTQNGDPDPNYSSFSISVTLNMAYLAYHTGLQSAHFNSPREAEAMAGEVMYFDPMIQHDPADSLWVNFISPMADCSTSAGYILPYQYLPSSHNTMTIYHPTGLLIWDTPPLGDIYTNWDILYTVSAYRNDIFAYSIMRDMIIVVSPPDTTTGLSAIAAGADLKCYPSPSSGIFTIDMTGYGAGEKQISIYDQLGQVVYQTLSSLDKIQVNDRLTSGLYTVSVTQDARKEYARVVIE